MDNNGGPAFPVSHDMALIAGLQNAYGMTLRDYFAAKAMQGMCAGFASPEGEWPDSECLEHYEVVASHAYMFADAMINERNKQ